MNYYLVCPTTLSHSSGHLLTYHSDVELPIGSLVKIPLGRRSALGLVFEKTVKPKFDTKAVGELLDLQPLPGPILKLSKWMSEYYATPMPLVLQTILPRGLQKTRRPTKNVAHPSRKRTNFVLNKAQKATLDIIEQAGPGTVLLRGVTGSGKTAVYIEHAKKIVSNGQSVIILVPEIALTAQLVAEFANHFSELLVTHSTMTEAQRHQVWQACLSASEPTVVVGPRSAMFMPLQNVGLIVIDECHEPAYKQDQAPRYNALRVASVLATLHKTTLVMGSATPSVVDTYLAESSGRPVAIMSNLAVKDAIKPEVHIVDLTKKRYFSRHRFFSNILLDSLEQSLAEGKQSLLFHNRRGTAPLTLCQNCGYMSACPRCVLPLTLHSDKFVLWCHVCSHQEKVPPNCPECGQPDIIHKGIGTKLIADELVKQFPKANIARFDADARTSEQVHARYQELYDGKIDIIVGTQMIAKGLDLPHLNLVGIVQADGGLALPDYTSAERVFQLIYQVSGRVGRNSAPSRVVVQTYQPSHPSVELGVKQDYQEFYNFALSERRRASFPPFVYLLKLTCSYKSEAAAVGASRKLADEIRQRFLSVEILGPTPSFYERLGGSYRWQLIVKSKSRSTLLKIIEIVPKQKWYIDIDPSSIL